MSLISSRVSLTHLCATERNANLGSDDGWGNPIPPAWVVQLTDVPCRAWVTRHETVITGSNLAVVVETRLIVPIGTDIVDGDRVSSVTLRGDVVYDGPLSVQAVLRRRDYLEVVTAKAT